MATGDSKPTTMQSGRETDPARRAGAPAGIVLLCGLYLMIAPWITGFGSAANLAVSNTVAGFALALLAVLHALFLARMRGMSWVVPVIGVWIVVSPWVIYQGEDVGLTTTAWIANSLAGVLVVLMGATIASLSVRASR